MGTTKYQSIVFPSRAEELRDQIFGDYRVFFEYWDGLAEKIRDLYEELATARHTTAILIYAPQGAGKTLFADKLDQGLSRAAAGTDTFGDKSNLWHRITGGLSLSQDLIKEATRATRLQHIEDDPKWVEGAKEWYKGKSNNEHCIIVADNAERGYFLQGLLDLDNAHFLQLGKSDAAYQMAAERFVVLARTYVRPAMFIFLTNNKEFAQKFTDEVNKQHENLVRFEKLPFPTMKDKETVVRVNVNILNSVTYWYCLDRTGPEGKKQVLEAVKSNTTFPGVYSAVNEAFSQADRTGRPANKCVLSLFVFTDAETIPESAGQKFGPARPKWGFENSCIRIEHFDSEWACALDGINERQAKMLSSEWSLRIITVSNRVVNALLSEADRENFKNLITDLSKIHGIGTHDATMDAYWKTIDQVSESFPTSWDHNRINDFWNKGQARSHDYESALKMILPNYNSGSMGSLTYRPDFTVRPYRVCSIIEADAEGDINSVIRRDAHMFEFTALKSYSFEAVKNYLSNKITNYISILEQQ